MVTPFAPLHRIDGYLPIEDHGLIGDGTTAALIGRDGVVSWLCMPRFDSPPLFCRLVDAKRGGAFTVTPEELVEARQFYEPDSGVLVTELRSRSGLIRLTDALTLRSGANLAEDVAAGRAELLRSVSVLQGRVRLRIEVEPQGGARAERHAGGFQIRRTTNPERDLWLFSTNPLEGLRTVCELEAGNHLHLMLRYGEGSHRYHAVTPEAVLQGTIDAWHRWMRHFHYKGPQGALVRRSAITVKLLDYFPTGAMVAAPTSSLREAIGGSRNWDYRYAWIRDAAFSVYALRRIGLEQEAAGFLGWVLDAIERGRRPKVLYDLDGRQPLPERKDPDLEGYRRSRPMRWGNGAAEQWQHDLYGEILDCAYQWASRGGAIDEALYRYLPDESPDGLPGHEGAFLLCSFWLVDNLAKQGRLDEATSSLTPCAPGRTRRGSSPSRSIPAAAPFWATIHRRSAT